MKMRFKNIDIFNVSIFKLQYLGNFNYFDEKKENIKLATYISW